MNGSSPAEIAGFRARAVAAMPELALPGDEGLADLAAHAARL